MIFRPPTTSFVPALNTKSDAGDTWMASLSTYIQGTQAVRNCSETMIGLRSGRVVTIQDNITIDTSADGLTNYLPIAPRTSGKILFVSDDTVYIGSYESGGRDITFSTSFTNKQCSVSASYIADR